MKAALYARVSTTDKGQDVQMQLNELRDWCNHNKHTYIEYIDEGISGSKEHRPQLDKLMQDADNHLFDMVVVWKLDRLSRSLIHLVNTLDYLHKKKIALRSHTQNLDTTTPEGKLMFQLLGIFAEFERDIIIERIRAGMKHAKEHGTKSGKAIGRPQRELSPNQIERFTQLIGAGMSGREIAKEMGLPKSTVYDILTRFE